jgi:membrane protein implicated in regulation of membrane protease activity
MTGVYAWLAAALFFLIFEMGHPGLFYWLSFSLGSLVAALLSWYDYSWQLAGVGFLVSSLLAIVLLKLTVGKLIKKHGGAHTLTNTDALIGTIGVVVEPVVADKPGRVKLGGEEWLARSSESLQAGARVRVVAVRGSHVVITLLNEQA